MYNLLCIILPLSLPLSLMVHVDDFTIQLHCNILIPEYKVTTYIIHVHVLNF